MKIYTRTGDGGQTALFGAGRVDKDDPRVCAYGAVDELNAVVGWAVVEVEDGTLRERLERLQHDLFALGSTLATTPAVEGRKRPDPPPLPAARIDEMERWIDEADGELPELRSFILPGGSRGAAALHLARTACRRAEREVVTLARTDAVEEDVLRYLNRLSDLLFTFARLENHRAGVPDVAWRKEDPE
jgi:cob(I)alamin adenosyltransferase